MRNRKHIRKYQQGGVSGLGVLPQASDIAFQPVVGVLPLNSGQEFARGLQQALQAQQIQAQLQRQQREEERRNEAQRRLINNALVEAADPVFGLKTYNDDQRQRLDDVLSKRGLKRGELPPVSIENLEEFTRQMSSTTSDRDFQNLAGEIAATEEAFKKAQELYNKDPNKFDIDRFNTTAEAFRSGEELEFPDGSKRKVNVADLAPGRFIIQPTFEEEAINKLSADDRLELARGVRESGGDPNDPAQLLEYYMGRTQPMGDYFTQFFGDSPTETESRIIARGRQRILEGTLDPENELSMLEFISSEYDQLEDGTRYSSNPEVNAYLSNPAIPTSRINEILEEIDDKGLDIKDINDVEPAHANVRGRTKSSSSNKNVYSDCKECRTLQLKWNKFGMDTTSEDAQIIIRSLSEQEPATFRAELIKELPELLATYPQLFPDSVTGAFTTFPILQQIVEDIDPDGTINTSISGDAVDTWTSYFNTSEEAAAAIEELGYEAKKEKGKLVLKYRTADLPDVRTLQNMDFGTAPAPTTIFDAFRQVESGGEYNILQGETAPGVGTSRGITGASGGYQFVWGSHGDAIKAVTGIEPVPLTAEDRARFKQNPKLKDLSDKELGYVKAFVNSPEDQEEYMLHQYRTQYLPLLSDYLEINDGRYSQPELMYIMHHEGPEGGKTFLRTGKSAHDTKTRDVTKELTNALSRLNKFLSESGPATIQIDEPQSPPAGASQTVEDLINSFNR